ncbi:ATP-NAD kinase [Ascodesmis nigricans]|uniref:ATP-NAD kinase n=1 Tax=Ascodesmis nigricans TaxID=341454 RepID=A0A4S2N4C4_9PEZI|nr:ATP-NAD kinase [Ascodesmis nigricans]
MIFHRHLRTLVPCLHRQFSVSTRCLEVRPITKLPPRIQPNYTKSRHGEIELQWPAGSRPRNIMFVKKPGVQVTRDALVEFAEHITTTYPETNIILEPTVAASLHHRLSKPVYTLPPPNQHSSPFPFTQSPDARTPYHFATDEPTSPPISPASPDPTQPFFARNLYQTYADAVITLGGDGTILYAASLFSTTTSVPPFLTFAMGTLGFLGTHKYSTYESAFRSLYTAATASSAPLQVLPRHRLSAVSSSGHQLNAMNELTLHRGQTPHLAHIDIEVNGHLLTEAVADGIIISTPTGSTAYSLSSGGCILHPSVGSLLLTPICPRSLSFRPLVLPRDVEILVRLSRRSRGNGVEVSVDGRTWGTMAVGEEVRVRLEGGGGHALGTGEIENSGIGMLGIPCVKREGGEDAWVGGLNRLLKFNYAFGEEME